MQPVPSADSAPDPDGDWMMRRCQAPTNEVAASVPFDFVLANNGDLAVTIEGFRVYSTGVGLDLRVLLRHNPREPDFSDIFFDGRQNPPGTFLLWIEFADGRHASSNTPWTGTPPAPDEALLSLTGGRAGWRENRVEYFLSPVPTPGPLIFHARSDALGIAETVVTFDAAALVDAQPRVVELWPWQPEPLTAVEPEPPVHPTDTLLAETE